MTKSNRRNHCHKRRINRKHRCGHIGGAVVMPAEYFGSDSGRYSAEVANSYSTAYGPSLGVSQGTLNGNMVGPNLAYGPTASSLQTGGLRHRSKKYQRRRRSNRNSRNKH
jgi:hypothetical protein